MRRSRVAAGPARRRDGGAATATWPAGWAAAGLIAVITVLLVMGARPIADSDLWYHLAYARQMLSSGSLILDHTTFSWTPSDNIVIYCAWLAQLALYGVHELGGLPALFVGRYVLLLAVLGGFIAWAQRLGVLRHPVTWSLLVVALLMSSGAVYIKPNMVSYPLLSVVVLLWLWIRRTGESAWRWAYALPIVMLVWVNSHGGFVMGLGFLALGGVGELVNAHLSPPAAVPRPLRRHLLAAVGLCFAAVFITPYGWRYPLQFFTVDLSAVDLQAVRDYDSIFATSQRGLHYVEYGATMLMLLVALSLQRLRRWQIDWGLVLANCVFAGAYVYYARLTPFWPPVALGSALLLLADRDPGITSTTGRRTRFVSAAALVGSLALGALAIRSDLIAPPIGTWVGFGNSYWNPEEEAEYITRHFADAKIGNDYNAGGYLIWKAWPRAKVFIDARYFPYRSWFQEYLGLETGRGIGGLMAKYPADLWCIEYILQPTIAWFRASPDWEPAFYGASAVVFVPRGTPLPGSHLQAGAGIGEIRNLYQALLVLGFALGVQDVSGAEQIVAGMERRFDAAGQRPLVARARAVVDGLHAYHARDYERAVRLLAGGVESFPGVSDVLARSAIFETRRLWMADDLASARNMAVAAVRFSPGNVLARYNASAIAWWQRQRTPGSADESWRADLEALAQMPARPDDGSPDAAGAARALLSGRSLDRPPLLVPLEP